MRLFVIRHGPAEARDARRWRNDEDRPLSTEGTRSTRQAMRGLAKLTESVDHLLTSPALRARRTAEIYRDALEEPPTLTPCPELRPGTTASKILTRVGQLPRPCARVAVVGHEPSLGEVMGLALIGEAISLNRLSKAGAAELEFGKAWVPSGARLDWLLTRRQLMRL